MKFFLLALSIGIVSCTSIYKKADNLHYGMTKEEVVRIMGTPDEIKYGNGYENDYYSQMFRDRILVVYENGKLKETARLYTRIVYE